MRPTRALAVFFFFFVAFPLAAAPARAQSDATGDAEAPALASGPSLAPAEVAAADAPSPAPEDAVVSAQIRQRNELRTWHLVFANLTWASSSVSTLMSYLHFNDAFGWSGNPMNAGCATGSTLLGTDFCRQGMSSVPYGSALAVLSTFYSVTFSIALVMPDPLGVGDGDGQRATIIRLHRALRWVTLGSIGAQIILAIIAASVDFGADFSAARAVGATQLSLSSVGYATMLTQGILGSILAW